MVRPDVEISSRPNVNAANTLKPRNDDSIFAGS
jgi:hypothetical protein